MIGDTTITLQRQTDLEVIRSRILQVALCLALPAAVFAYFNAQRFAVRTDFDVAVALVLPAVVAVLLLWALWDRRAVAKVSAVFIASACLYFSLRLAGTFFGPHADAPLPQLLPPYIAWLPLIFVLSFVLLKARLAVWLSLGFYAVLAGLVIVFVLNHTQSEPLTALQLGLLQQFVLAHGIYIVLLSLVPLLQRRYTQTLSEVQALREQSEAERRLAAIIDATQDAIYVIDLQGVISDWNPAAQALYGYSEQAMLGQSTQGLYPPELADLFEHNLNLVATGQFADYAETVRVDASGRRLDVRVAVTPLRDAQNEVTGAAITSHDIGESKRARSALAESEQRFRGTFDNAPIGLALVSTEGRWLEVNTVLCDMLGYSSDEFLQTDFQTITHPDDLETDLALVNQLLAGEINTYRLDKRYFHKNGAVVWIVLAVSLVRDEQQQPLYFVAQIEDVTQTRRAEAQLLQRSRELESSNRELEAYAHVVSHDLREPLRGIGGFVKLLASHLGDDLDDTAREYVQMITDSVQRGDTLIAGLLEYARIDGEQQIETLDSDAELADVLTSLQPQIEQSDAVIRAESLHAVRANALGLRRIFQNLVGNAIKFSALNETPGHHPEVGISSAVFGSMVEFTISDNGPGIAPEHASEVFRIFRRLHGRKVSGTGIGLAICKKLVDSFGGEIRVESSLGGGAYFIFSLPAAAATV